VDESDGGQRDSGGRAGLRDASQEKDGEKSSKKRSAKDQTKNKKCVRKQSPALLGPRERKEGKKTVGYPLRSVR
jgi:hypothetical protein